MTRRLPDTVHVHPFDYTVSTDRTELLERCLSEETDLLGHTDHKSLRILVDVGAEPAVCAETLLHEILHTLTVATGLTAELDPDVEEGLVTRLTPRLLAVLRDNPAVIDYLTG